MNEEQILANPLNEWYDRVMYNEVYEDFYDFTDFANHGYWDARTRTTSQACLNLMDRLLELVPSRSGRILDVACGKGATTEYLLKHYAPEQITAINISDKQLETAREKAPGVDFRLMDATRLEFADNTFDTVLCVEAAFHFDTRRKFLAEALRVLKPGGRLVLTDILVTLEAERGRAFRYEANFVPNPDVYSQVLREVGFRDPHVIDATVECWHNHFRYLVNKYHEQFLAREITLPRLQEILSVTYSRVADIEYYLLAAAEKP